MIRISEVINKGTMGFLEISPAPCRRYPRNSLLVKAVIGAIIKTRAKMKTKLFGLKVTSKLPGSITE